MEIKCVNCGWIGKRSEREPIVGDIFYCLCCPKCNGERFINLDELPNPPKQ